MRTPITSARIAFTNDIAELLEVLAERHLRVFEQVFVVLAMHEREGEGGRGRGEGGRPNATDAMPLLAMITTLALADNGV